MSHIIVRAFRHLFPPPPPPRILSGNWTAEERSFVIQQMEYAVEHQTQGRFHRLPEKEKSDFRRDVNLIEAGSIAQIDQKWAFVRLRYQVNAVLRHDLREVVEPRVSWLDNLKSKLEGPFTGQWM